MYRLWGNAMSKNIDGVFIFPSSLFRLRCAMIRIISIISLLFSTPLSALDFYPEDSMDFSFDLERTVADWSVTGVAIETRVSRLGFSLYEYQSEYFQPGLHGGYLDVSQLNNATTAGMNLTGNYLGVSVRSKMPLSEHFTLLFRAAYIYHTTDQQLISQQTQLKWSETEFSAAFDYNVGRMGIFVGAAYYDIDGDEIASGTITQTRSISEENNTATLVGIRLPVDATGSIQVQMESGGRKMTRLDFMRRF